MVVVLCSIKSHVEGDWLTPEPHLPTYVNGQIVLFPILLSSGVLDCLFGKMSDALWKQWLKWLVRAGRALCTKSLF